MSTVRYVRAKNNYGFLNCLVLNGVSAQKGVSIPANGKFSLGGGDWTLSMWINAIEFRSCNIFRFGPASLGSSYMSLEMGTGGTFRMQTGFDYNTFKRIDHTVPQSLNTWLHIVFTRRGGSASANLNFSNYFLYINGVGFQGENYTFPQANIWGTDPTLLGDRTSTTQGARIRLDEVAIYHTGFTQAEVTALYNSGLGNEPPRNKWGNVVAYYRADSKNGRVLVDDVQIYAPARAAVNGSVLGFTDAEVAANGQPQSGQTAWVNHFTYAPITV